MKMSKLFISVLFFRKNLKGVPCWLCSGSKVLAILDFKDLVDLEQASLFPLNAWFSKDLLYNGFVSVSNLCTCQFGENICSSILFV